MKADSKERYVSAMREHALRKTRGTSQPVVVNAYRFFDEACARHNLDHTFSKGSQRRVIALFDEAFSKACTSDDEGFPIIVHKVNEDLIEKVGHGKQAIIDSEMTPEVYKKSSTTKGNNPHAGWALFGPDANKNHPIVRASHDVTRKRITTSTENFNNRVAALAPDLLIGETKSSQKLIAG